MTIRGLEASKFSLDEAINHLMSSMLKKGFKVDVIHDYKAIDGKIEYQRVRLRNLDTGEKKILPIHINEDGLYVLSEPTYKKGEKILYNLVDVAKSNAVIYVVEGESCVDLLMELGVLATTSGSWNSSAGADWSPLSGRKVIIWPDFDAQGQKYAEEVARILLYLKCNVSIIDVEKLGLSHKEDCVDWVAKNPGSSQEDISSLPVKDCELKDEPDESGSKSALLLHLVKNVEFFHDDQNIAYATIAIQDHHETFNINGKQFRGWLSRSYWETYDEVVSAQTVMNALATMEGIALYEGLCQKVFTRVGALNNEVYINLANEKSQTIKISRDGWFLLNDSPVKFVRSNNMKSLPIPISGGDLNLLWKYVNIPEQYHKLVIAWLLECIRPDTDYPILVLHGTQGSAKSTSQQFLCNLVDPGGGSLRNAPRNADDIMIAAANSHVLSFNNLTKLSIDNQNDFCCVSTGGIFGKRKLYSDIDEVMVETKRPLIMNGINNVVTASDLMSRSIIIELPEIDATNRRSGQQLQDEFKHDYPVILGGLYDLYVEVLNMLPNVHLTEMPRLADFSLLGTAMEKVLGLEQGVFMASFEANMKCNMYNCLEEHPIIEALLKFMCINKIFKGTYSELLNELSGSSYKPQFTQGWPNSPHALARILKNLFTPLRNIGILVKFPIKRSNKGKLVEINEFREQIEY